jgi:hypothetical protein
VAGVGVGAGASGGRGAGGWAGGAVVDVVVAGAAVVVVVASPQCAGHGTSGGGGTWLHGCAMPLWPSHVVVVSRAPAGTPTHSRAVNAAVVRTPARLMVFMGRAR